MEKELELKRMSRGYWADLEETKDPPQISWPIGNLQEVK